MLLYVGRRLSINWLGVAYWFRDHPTLSKVLSDVYVSIAWQPALLVAALAYADPERLRRMRSASALALSITVLSYMFLPAIGPYEYFKLSASDFPSVLAPGAWVAPGITEALRSGAHQTSFEGLVTFPSFHAVTAVLFGHGWLGVPIIGMPFFVLNIAMLISCVPIGSHYIIDVIVGIALAIAGLRASKQYFKATDRELPLARWEATKDGQRIFEAFRALPVIGAMVRFCPQRPRRDLVARRRGFC